ncbi:hypothetical protein [Rhizobium rhizophilum]|uniref:Class I SAM-dependent methyltransferase n=1 Tax=Rhizobium rhizophilum TaxID=1850373 RepID=A0ABY2QNV6_9HYPH|nr:hypothetical protein [Rhizobium rhizophilum]THV10582.1 hypothetical protein E9677_22785 [Rhizobium rhizophilum]
MLSKIRQWARRVDSNSRKTLERLEALERSLKAHNPSTKNMPDKPGERSNSKPLNLDGVEDDTAQWVRKLVSTRLPWLAAETPWFTASSVLWLEANLLRSDRVLEYGGGRSSIWWAKHVEGVTTVEASADWAAAILAHAMSRPDLLKRLRIYMAPADWNPSFNSGLKPYWKQNDVLSEEDALLMERDLLTPTFDGHNVWAFDGAVRPLVMMKRMHDDTSNVDIIVVDNTESQFTSALADELIPADHFTRLDFCARPGDPIPDHQEGKHITSIFVRPDRLRSAKIAETPYPTALTRELRLQHQESSDLSDDGLKGAMEKLRQRLMQIQSLGKS